MQAKCMVISDTPNEYQSQKRGIVKNQRLTLLDLDGDSRFINTFDLDLKDGEKEKYAGKLVGKTVTVGITNFRFLNNRLQADGRILDVMGNGSVAK